MSVRHRTVRAGLVAAALVTVFFAAQIHATETTFSYGGYVKFDALGTYYHNGSVDATNALRDFHIPGSIPVGSNDEHFNFDSHAKQSRLHFQTLSKFDDGREIKGYLEMDFLLSASGDERVSNSYNPRIRHFYFSTGPWLFGQTWMTFMVIVLPDDLDFIGTPEGTTFGRQPQLRYTRGGWQVSLENSETTVTSEEDGSRIVTGTSQLPDLVARRNFSGEWGSLGVAAILRQLNYDDGTFDDTEVGFGFTAGAKVVTVAKDDVRVQATAGHGLGRYVGLNFANAAAVDTLGHMSVIDEVAGFVAYRHFWNEEWRSTVDVSFFQAANPSKLDDTAVNRDAQSYSANLLYSPLPEWTVGLEYTFARRELENGTDGRYDRVQFSALYNFGYSSSD
jgi:hypothetical protein